MIWSVSWKNIWRNPLRSWVIISAIAIGMFAGFFSATFVKGWMNQRMEAGVETEVSYLQIHHHEFRENYDIKMSMPDGVDISNKLLQVQGIDGSSPRIVLQSMVSSAETGTGVRIIGVDPAREKTTSNLYSFISDGEYFDGIKNNPAVIGEKLAKKLKVKLRSKIVVTIQDLEGNITQGAFRIYGIYDLTNNNYEEMNLFVRYDDLKRLANLPDEAAHEITVHITKPGAAETIRSALAAEFPSTEVLTWKEVTPELGYLIEIGNMYTYIFVVIILLALGFGIVNTMLMVVLERIKELGMLMAVGMNKTRVFLMLMLETVMLTFTGGIIGIILGILFYLATAKNGINLSMYAEGLEAFGYNSIIIPVLETEMVVVIGIMVILTGIIASIYPARKALKYNPADALRIDM